ncbi:binding-protein-dependent transport system inner membrane component family protein [Asticcacaulis biprosthecium C19]|uniref:Binding-protein-dependent transport system inner membrane component family protein n=1 Tax=Asticcacaulis biprosthecium C19 TaxID=715226 RepID=F4QU35_9CAUL|nr:ABC transporter permease [Asticcacaulis biprosthecium]EGF89335.1 binding-protein-dependent transport system inner membrane component family protein [Asticcacaulis biprosthecium C19]
MSQSPSRKLPPAPLEYLRRWPIQLSLVVVAIFLYAPLLTMMLFSFNDDRSITQWSGFSLKYYKQAFQNESLIIAFMNSLTIAFFSTLISLVVGAMAAIVLWRFRFGGKTLFDGTMAVPIVVPEICLGVGMLVFFAKVLPWPQGLPWPLNLGAIIIAHVSFSFPFVAVVVRARLGSFNRELEEAAKDLGASDFRALMDVVIPHIQPSLIAGALLAFTLSLDDFVITFFTAGPDTVTFPVKVYSMVRFSVTPEVNAASTILIVVTVLLTFLALKFQGSSALTAGHDGGAGEKK